MRSRAASLIMALLVAASRLEGQGGCVVNNQAACEVGGDATHAITVAVSYVARLTVSANTVTLPAATVPAFDAGAGAPGSVNLDVQANTPWRVSIRAVSATWAGSPATARQDKPASDLEWSLVAGSGYTPASTTNVSVSTGGATAGTNFTLYLRPVLTWSLDAAGNYQLPLELTITSP